MPDASLFINIKKGLLENYKVIIKDIGCDFPGGFQVKLMSKIIFKKQKKYYFNIFL